MVDASLATVGNAVISSLIKIRNFWICENFQQHGVGEFTGERVLLAGMRKQRITAAVRPGSR